MFQESLLKNSDEKSNLGVESELLRRVQPLYMRNNICSFSVLMLLLIFNWKKSFKKNLISDRYSNNAGKSNPTPWNLPSRKILSRTPSQPRQKNYQTDSSIVVKVPQVKFLADDSGWKILPSKLPFEKDFNFWLFFRSSWKSPLRREFFLEISSSKVKLLPQKVTPWKVYPTENPPPPWKDPPNHTNPEKMSFEKYPLTSLHVKWSR